MEVAVGLKEVRAIVFPEEALMVVVASYFHFDQLEVHEEACLVEVVDRGPYLPSCDWEVVHLHLLLDRLNLKVPSSYFSPSHQEEVPSEVTYLCPLVPLFQDLSLIMLHPSCS